MTLLESKEVLVSGRIALSPLPRGALDDMPWLTGALSPEWTLDDLEVAEATSDAVLVSDAEGEPMGLALVQFDTPENGDATIVFLAMQPERRFRGLGGEAGLAVERLVRQRFGTKQIYVGVPEGRGLAVYFWLRLGFRPLNIAESPHRSLGLTDDSLPGIWMVRNTP